MPRAPLLFLVPPDQIYEHPTNLPTQEPEIPLGPVTGWVAYAHDFDGSNTIIRVPDPEIQREFGRLFILVGKDQFWFSPHHRDGKPCWYQSGATLRFIEEKSLCRRTLV